jgi:hypothetical protein
LKKRVNRLCLALLFVAVNLKLRYHVSVSTLDKGVLMNVCDGLFIMKGGLIWQLNYSRWLTASW